MEGPLRDLPPLIFLYGFGIVSYVKGREVNSLINNIVCEDILNEEFSHFVVGCLRAVVGNLGESAGLEYVGVNKELYMLLTAGFDKNDPEIRMKAKEFYWNSGLDKDKANLHLIPLICLLGSELTLIVQQLEQQIALKNLRALSKVYKNLRLSEFAVKCVEESIKTGNYSYTGLPEDLKEYILTPCEIGRDSRILQLDLDRELDNISIEYTAAGIVTQATRQRLSHLFKQLFKGNPEKTCFLCGQKLRDLSRAREHILAHKRIHMYKCTICDLGFASYTSKTRHMRSSHS